MPLLSAKVRKIIVETLRISDTILITEMNEIYEQRNYLNTGKCIIMSKICPLIFYRIVENL